MASGGGVGVHPQDARLREQLPQLLLHLLGACADALHPAAAFGAGFLHRLGMAAVMAHEPPVGGMIGHGHAAPGALGHIAALSAQEVPAAAPAVQKEDALLSGGQIPFQFLPQRGADKAGISGQHLLPHIRDQHLGQGAFVVAPPQQRLLIGPLLRRPGGFHRGGGGAQHQGRALPGTEVLGHLPGVVAGRVFRLITPLLLLVHHDEAQVFQGGKNGGPGAQHHADFSPADALPLVVALRHFQGTVEHGGLFTEIGTKLPHHLGSQHDLRHQHHGRLSQCQCFLNQPQINLGLAAAGHAPQQRHGGPVSPDPVQDLLKGCLLFFIQQDLRPRLHILKGRHPQLLFLGKGDQSRLFHGFQGPGGRAGVVADLCRRGPPRRSQKVDHLIPGRSGAPLRLRQGKGIPGIDGQLHHPVELVPHLSAGVGLTGENLGLFQGFQRFFRLSPQGVPQKLDLCPASLLRQQVQRLPGAGNSRRGGPGRIRFHIQGPDLPKAVPQPGGENGFHRLEHRAEIPAPHPQGQVDPGLVQHRLRVQHAADGLYPRQLGLRGPGQDQSLAFLIAPAKGHHHPDAGHRRIRQMFRHQVAVGLINGIGRGADRNLYHVRGLHASPSSKCLFSGQLSTEMVRSMPLASILPSATSWIARVTGFSSS